MASLSFSLSCKSGTGSIFLSFVFGAFNFCIIFDLWFLFSLFIYLFLEPRL